MALAQTILNSHIWETTLAPQQDDDAAEARERLRSAFTSFRDRSGLLAAEIRRDLPQLTLHDQSHLDALWETAATILGSDFVLTPAEGFVLGGAFLLHDLGMAVPSFEGGIEALKEDRRWADLVVYEYQTQYDRAPTQKEIKEPDDAIHQRVVLNLLQQTHAANAERLAFLSFSNKDSDTPLHLIEDSEVRQAFGRIIGQVAHSHWWSISELERCFQRTMGAPHWCPRSWTVDPLKVASVLRCADAAQIDARRAPLFLSAITKVDNNSADHWAFQQRLNKPYLEDDSLVFTTGQSFSMAEASAWWLCLEMLRMVDTELRNVDALFADKRLPRFSARRVAGIESPQRLVSYVQTDGWLPIDATIHVTDLPRVVTSIGGEELYGRNPKVAIRELIQNSSDAIRARRVFEGRDPSFGSIKISINSTEDVQWLTVIDDGIGMSQSVLTGFLLDFGRTFWGSPEMQREFPGLLASGIRQVGKYGIGFFSVFMLADEVQVVSRRSDAAAKDTLVLEFSSGVQGRPILREARHEEQLVDGGTLVRLKLKNNSTTLDDLLEGSHRKGAPRSLASLCKKLCPTLDVDLYVEEKDKVELVIKGGDWVSVEASEFLKRMPSAKNLEDESEEELEVFRRQAAENLKPLFDLDGNLIGRALVTVGFGSHYNQGVDLHGVVTVGGLSACQLSGITGALVGTPMRASRDAAKPIVDDVELARWASEQADLVPNLWKDPKLQAGCARYIRILGGDTGALPICKNKGEWCSAKSIRERTDLSDQIIFIDHFTIEYNLKHIEHYTLSDHVFVVEYSGYPGLLQTPGYHDIRWPGNMKSSFGWGSGGIRNTLGGAIIEAVATVWKVEPEAIYSTNDFEREPEVKIGSSPNGDVIDRALVLTKPKQE